ncbi:MAG: hypothetical protein ABSE79_13910 [Terriglobia bacterium]|jgi:hypothetical protein
MGNPAMVSELQAKVDARLKRLFTAKGAFSVKNYRPPTGIGLFDFDYNIGQRTVDVRVRVRFEWLNKGEGVQSAYINWKPEEKAAFAGKALRVCREAWSNRYRFECRRPGWEEFQASVNIKFKETALDPQYIIECRKVERNHETAWSGGCTHGATVWPYKANFSNWGVETRDDFMGDQIFNFKEKQLTDTLQQSKLSVIPISGKDENVDTASRDKLYSFADRVGKIVASDQVSGIHCNIYGFPQGNVFSNPGNKRAEALRKLLKLRLGGSSFFSADTSSASRNAAQAILRQQGLDPKTFSGVCLFVHVPAKSTRSIPTHYIVITHEFGHMLGCPDEYTGINCTGIKALMELDDIVPSTFNRSAVNAKQLNPLGTDKHFLNESMHDTAPDNVKRLQQMQKNFAYQTQQAGVASPFFMTQGTAVNAAEMQKANEAFFKQRDIIKAQFGRDSKQYEKFDAKGTGVVELKGATDSIMFTGQKILPAHYIPIWSCLASATREFIDPSEWAIV